MSSSRSVFFTCDDLSKFSLSEYSAVSISRSSLHGQQRGRNVIELRALEWTIGRFYLSLNQLFVSLQLWSMDSLSSAQVSDVFVRLATDFNATLAILESYDIFVFEFFSFEKRLREVLEACLNESVASEAFHTSLTAIDAIITDTVPRLASKFTAVKQMLV